MIKIYVSLVIAFLCTNFLYAQEKKELSMLVVQPKSTFSNYIFNTKLKKELNTSLIFIYSSNDLDKNNFNINIRHFSKPISNIALESYPEMEFYKNALPKKIDFINFQRHINP